MADRPCLPIRATLCRCAAVKDRSAFDAFSYCPPDTMQALAKENLPVAGWPAFKNKFEALWRL
jgi:hypothetical protein